MPNKQSAKKALRQSKKRAARNLTAKIAYKEAVKTVKKGLATGEKELATAVKFAQKNLGKAAKIGVIKKRAASRKISRLMKAVNKAVR